MIRPSTVTPAAWLCLISLCLISLCMISDAAFAWDSRDVEAAERFRDAERERAESFRRDVAQGRAWPGAAAGSAPHDERAPAPQREAREGSGAFERAIEDEVDRWADRVGEWGEELGAELLDGVERVLREALGGGDR